jgi:hypothetical protein
MKPFGGSLAISTEALERESQKKHAPSEQSAARSASMKAKRQFPDDILAVLRESKGLHIRSVPASTAHRHLVCRSERPCRIARQNEAKGLPSPCGGRCS